MTRKKNKHPSELSLDDLKDITVESGVKPDTDNSDACDIRRPSDCD